MPWKNLKRFFSKFFKQPGYALSVFIKRVRAYLSYLLAHGKSSLPESITLFLTHRCNLHCKMCGQWGESGVTKKLASELIRQELEFTDLKKLIDEISHFKPSITLFGGEPLLYPDCGKLIKYIKAKGMHCLMISNGSLLKNLAKEVVDSGLDELNISIDGAKELHDQIRGMPGLFDKISQGVSLVNEYKKEKKTPKPLINLQCTITSYNYEKLEQLITVARDWRANSLTFHNLIFLSKKMIEEQKKIDRVLGCSSQDWEGFVNEPQIDADKLYLKMAEILKGRYDFNVDFYPNLSRGAIKDYYDKPDYVPCEYPSRCLSPWIVGYVFPDGQVRPCLNLGYSFGNIKENKFPEIWNSPAAVKFRTNLKKNKIFPACVRCTELYRY